MMSTFNILRQKLFRDFLHDPRLHVLGKSQFKSLVILYHTGELTMGELSERVGLEPGSFTSVVDSLVEKGHLERIRNPHDRRQVLLSLTTRGHSLIGEHVTRLNAHFEERLNGISDEERERFFTALHELYEISLTIGSKLR